MRSIGRPVGNMNDPRIEQAAQAAYESHHRGIYDITWNEMPDWQKERQRCPSPAVIALIEEQQPRHPLIRTTETIAS